MTPKYNHNDDIALVIKLTMFFAWMWFFALVVVDCGFAQMGFY